jgi:mRNA interferase HigB
MAMRVISRKALREFWEGNPASETPLRRWYTQMVKGTYRTFADLRAGFGSSTEWVGDYVVFDIGGNKFRLVAGMDFERGIAYIKSVMTHKEYDAWKP